MQPFFSKNGWILNLNSSNKWNFDFSKIMLVDEIEKAEVFLIPFTINYYFKNNFKKYLEKYNKICQEKRIQAFGFISGDFAYSFPEYKTITYFRMSGFRSRLGDNNKGFPAALTDRHHLYYHENDPIVLNKKETPIVGFCGHATDSKIEFSKQTIKYLKENFKRFFSNYQLNIYEILFQSAYVRYKLLKKIEYDKKIKTNFIYRKKYRAGAKNKIDLDSSTLEYYENIKESDYTLCIRGTGNFSIRLYETLMMGRIPIFINTDCLLPFSKIIDWKKHVIFIEWADISKINVIIKEFHLNITNNDFQKIQIKNRELWLNKLSPKGVFNSFQSIVNLEIET